MRNLALAPDASFQSSFHWNKADLPITLVWRSTHWRYVVPGLWLSGCLAWVWLVNMQTPGSIAVIPYALLFIGLPLLLVLAAGWWVMQLMRGRVAGKLVIHDDRIEWDFESESDSDQLADCGRFAVAGKRDLDLRIAWDVTDADEDEFAGWPRWTLRLLRLAWSSSDRDLYARDLGLERGDLESLCKLLNQLRDEAAARR